MSGLIDGRQVLSTYSTAITVRDNNTNGDTFDALIQAAAVAAGFTGGTIGYRGFIIPAYVPGQTGSAHPALVITTPRMITQGVFAAIAATDFTAHGEYNGVGEEYYRPADGDRFRYVRTALGSGSVSIDVTLLI